MGTPYIQSDGPSCRGLPSGWPNKEKNEQAIQLEFLKKAKKLEELENKAEVELPPPPKAMKGWKITRMKVKGWEMMDKYKSEAQGRRRRS